MTEWKRSAEEWCCSSWEQEADLDTLQGLLKDQSWSHSGRDDVVSGAEPGAERTTCFRLDTGGPHGDGKVRLAYREEENLPQDGAATGKT